MITFEGSEKAYIKKALVTPCYGRYWCKIPPLRIPVDVVHSKQARRLDDLENLAKASARGLVAEAFGGESLLDRTEAYCIP